MSRTTSGSHVTVLRAGNRAVLGMDGQESVVTYRNDPSPINRYEANFQFGGVADKGPRPGLQLKLTARDQPGNRVDAAAFNTAWNSLLQSLRVRLRD